MAARYDQLQAGWSVHDRDGEKIGDIEEVGQNYLLVQKGLFFPKDLYIPMSYVTAADARDSSVTINASKHEVETLGWDGPPAEGDWDTTRGAASASQEDSVTIPLREERIEAERRQRDAGEVNVGKRVVEQQQDFEVPVTREEVDITRRRVDRPADAGDAIVDDGETVRVPVRAEDVDVRKNARVVEEVQVSKRPVTETKRVSETVRREEVDVDETGDVLTGAGVSRSTRSDWDEGAVTAGSRRSRDDDDLGDAAPEAGGAAAGAVGGAVVGGAVGGPPGAAIGGAVGAAGGAIAGDQAEEEIEDKEDDPYRS
jgi:uncharacterized protein (TIGR02271 family)